MNSKRGWVIDYIMMLVPDGRRQMDRWRAAWALLALAACFASSAAGEFKNYT